MSKSTLYDRAYLNHIYRFVDKSIIIIYYNKSLLAQWCYESLIYVIEFSISEGFSVFKCQV